MTISVLDKVENTEGRGENVVYQHISISLDIF